MHRVRTGDEDNHCRDKWQDDKLPNKATTVKKSPASSPPEAMVTLPGTSYPAVANHNFPPRRVHLILCFPITTFLLDLVYFRLSVLSHSGSIATHLAWPVLWMSLMHRSILTLPNSLQPGDQTASSVPTNQPKLPDTYDGANRRKMPKAWFEACTAASGIPRCLMTKQETFPPVVERWGHWWGHRAVISTGGIFCINS